MWALHVPAQQHAGAKMHTREAEQGCAGALDALDEAHCLRGGPLQDVDVLGQGIVVPNALHIRRQHIIVHIC